MLTNASASYHPSCIQKGVITPWMKKMSPSAFKTKCKDITDRERRYSTVNADGTLPADSAYGKRAKSKKFHNMSISEIYNYVKGIGERGRLQLNYKEIEDYHRSTRYIDVLKERKNIRKSKVEKKNTLPEPNFDDSISTYIVFTLVLLFMLIFNVNILKFAILYIGKLIR
jgi:hypothetical protein